jgi:tetratricopeptide (TPR) repeat protein
MPAGQRYAQALLNAASGVFKSLGLKARDAEAQIEVGFCYYREGLFDLARETLTSAIKEIEGNNRELETLALIRLAAVDRHAGRLEDALRCLNQASEFAEALGPRVTGRHQLEAATTLKNLGALEAANDYYMKAVEFYQRALREFEAVGNHRYAAIVENNHGYLLLVVGEFAKAAEHLLRSRNLFETLGDNTRRAQVDETIARLHIADGNLGLAHESVVKAVESLEAGDGEALLAEALVTNGIVLCRLKRFREAKATIDRGKQLADRCGDTEGVARALVAVVDEMLEYLGQVEKSGLEMQVKKVLEASCQKSTRQRLSRCLVRIRSSVE